MRVPLEEDGDCSEGGVDRVGINYSALKKIEDKLLMVEPLELVVRRCEFAKTLELRVSLLPGSLCSWSISEASGIEAA